MGSKMSSKTRFNLLLVEDDEACDGEVFAQWLSAAGTVNFSVVKACSLEEALRSYEEYSVDLTVLDLNLPDANGLEALESLQSYYPSIPIVIYTGYVDEHLAREAVRLGAQDYLVKGRMTPPSMVRTFVYAVERKRAEERLRQQEEQFRAVFESAPVGIMMLDSELTIVRANGACHHHLGWNDLSGLSFCDLVEADHREKLLEFLSELQEGPFPIVWDEDVPLQRHSGGLEWVSLRGVVTRAEPGSSSHRVLSLEFVTLRRDLESKLRQSQKMEAVGRLAGGIAHDFNNLFTTIAGHTQLVSDELSSESEVQTDLQVIQHSVDKASRLTRQLLTFSRLHTVKPELLELTKFVRKSVPLLTKILGKERELNLSLPSQHVHVLADRAQMEQLLLDILANAREATAPEGKVHFSLFSDPTKNQVFLKIEDDGVGMDEETKQKVVEPFFTTKEGHSGLGLSTVFGIVENMKGVLEIKSEPEAGTTVLLRLPLELSEEIDTTNDEQPSEHHGGKRILFVEDEQAIGKLVSRYLKRRGFEISLATNAMDALKVIEEESDRLSIVVSDVVMPGMSGSELARRIKDEYHDLPILLVSGYSPDERLRAAVEARELHFLAKPFRPAELEAAVNSILANNTNPP